MEHQLPADEDVRRQLRSVRAEVMSEVHATPAIESRRIRNLAVVGVLGLALSASSFAIAISGEEEVSYVRCFSELDPSSTHSDVLSAPTSDAHRSGKWTPLQVTEECDNVWASGAFEPGVDPRIIDAIHPVPPLTACRFNNGLAAVFPNTERIAADKLCGTLGLAVWKPVSGV